MMPDGDRQYLAQLCRDRAGFMIDPQKSYLMESRLAPLARSEGAASLGELMDMLRVRSDGRLVWAAVEALAPLETAFFRDIGVFEHLATEILPQLARARAGAPVRVLSAGCGSGQEPHSLAMIIDEQSGLAAKAELFAVDLSERAIEKGQAGLYSQFEVQRGLPARRLVRHFEKLGEHFAVAPRVRQMTRWRRTNLIDDISGLGTFDLVLCRHLLPHLAPSARERVLAGLLGVLAPGGRLVLGAGEAAPASLVACGPAVFSVGDAAVRSAA